MKRIKELTRQIFETTQKIEQEYPELYNFLNENPITLPTKEHVVIDSMFFPIICIRFRQY